MPFILYQIGLYFFWAIISWGEIVQDSNIGEWSDLPHTLTLVGDPGYQCGSTEGIDVTSSSLKYVSHGHQLGFHLIVRNRNRSENPICLGVWRQTGLPLSINAIIDNKAEGNQPGKKPDFKKDLDKKFILLKLKPNEAFAISYYLREGNLDTLANAKRIEWNIYLNSRHYQGVVPRAKSQSTKESKKKS